MALLIDGYNVLHAIGMLGRNVGPGTLERARRALINFLLAAVEPGELARTSVVFDAKDAPPGLPRVVKYDGLTVYFASNCSEADDLLEELIRADSAPRRLTVVSSDHRVQRAARRRKATAVDSDRWHAELARRRRATPNKEAVSPGKPQAPLDAAEVEAWLKMFGDVSIRESGQETSVTDSPDLTDADQPVEPEPSEPRDGEIVNPFPPGYGEDLLEEDEP